MNHGLPGRDFGVILRQLNISCQEIFPTAILVFGLLIVAVGHDFLLFFDGLCHKSEYAKGRLNREFTLKPIPNAVLA